MSDGNTTIQNQPEVTEAPTDGAVQVNDPQGDVTVQSGGQGEAPVLPGGARVESDEAK